MKNGLTNMPESDFCPNPDCPWHDPENIPAGIQWWRRNGTYISMQHGRIRRFICQKCGRSFSSRTSKNEWYLHFDGVDSVKLGSAWLAGSSLGEIAREYGITKTMVRTRLRRNGVLSIYDYEGPDAS